MGGVEVTGRTVEEAKDAALDELGVDESEAEFEVLQEPKAGLFGRLRAEARVRARVAPTSVRPKVERGSRRRGRKERADDGVPADTAPPAGPSASTPARPRGGNERANGGKAASAAPAANGGRGRGGSRSNPSPGPREERRTTPAADEGGTMDHGGGPAGDVGAVGEEFLRGLLAAFGIDEASVRRTTLDDGDIVELAVDGTDVGMLIGPRGQTLSAIQELTRTYASRRVGDGQPRIVVDVGGYRKARREALERFTRDVAAQVVATGVVKVLEPMPPADRKVVHDTANTIDGVSTTSEGEEPRRRVVIQPTESG